MEMMRDIKTEVEQMVEPILANEGFDLVETKLARHKNKYRLQVYADSDRGITLEDCAHLSQLIGAALEATDLFEKGYILEVSSPGVDRPLITSKDFRRRVGREMKIELLADGEVKTIRGTLTDVSDTTLTVAGEQGEKTIALEDVSRGKLII